MIGADLRASEAAGGHTIRHHVARPVEWLRSRLAGGPFPYAASTFTSLDEAQMAVTAAVAAHAERVSAWLSQSRDLKLVLHWHSATPLGSVLLRDAGTVEPANRVCVVLERLAGTDGDFFVRSAYPKR